MIDKMIDYKDDKKLKKYKDVLEKNISELRTDFEKHKV